MSFEDIRFAFREPKVQFITVLCAIAAWVLFVIFAGPHIVHAQDSNLPRPRFVPVMHQDSHYDDGFNNSLNFEVIHDKETGQEIVCVFSGGRSGCWLTGRTWQN